MRTSYWERYAPGVGRTASAVFLFASILCDEMNGGLGPRHGARAYLMTVAPSTVSYRRYRSSFFEMHVPSSFDRNAAQFLLRVLGLEKTRAWIYRRGREHENCALREDKTGLSE